MITGVSDGTLEIVPPAKPPAGTVPIDKVSDGLLPWFLRGFHLPLWLLYAIIVGFVVVFVLAAIFARKKFRPWTTRPVARIRNAVLLVVASIAIATALAAVKKELSRILAGETIRITNLTPASIAGVGPKPRFAVTPPDRPRQSTNTPSGADSPDAVAFRLATSDFADLLEVKQPTDPVYTPLNLERTRTTLLARLDPAVTIPLRTSSMISISRPWNPPDPITPIMAAPEFPQPMYLPLKDLSQDYILPGVGLIPTNSVSLLQTNHAFIEALHGWSESRDGTPVALQ